MIAMFSKAPRLIRMSFRGNQVTIAIGAIVRASRGVTRLRFERQQALDVRIRMICCSTHARLRFGAGR